jgi:predicted adenylyl cyclase CyaB
MRNLEAKFRLDDLEAARARAQALGYAARASFIQRDTFFRVTSGKLKLREQPPEAWLIHYDRGQAGGLMLSRYEIAPVADAERTRGMLSRALGAIAEVRKSRELLQRGNVRLHLDRVESLGSFGEVEAVLSADSNEAGRAELDTAAADIKQLLDIFRIGPEALVNASYFELMKDLRKI